MSFFRDVTLIPEDPILSIPPLFAADERKNKVNLGVGAYRDAEGAPLVLRSVVKAEKKLLESGQNKEYLPIDGDPKFQLASFALAFGKNSPHLKRAVLAQTIGGSGALKVAGAFLKEQFPKATLYLSAPTWANHRKIFSNCVLNLDSYPYVKNNRFLFDEMCQSIDRMNPGDLILLHAGCHNPTGIDPSLCQWQEISKRIQDRGLFVLFDMAYQGFGASPDEDAKTIRLFADQGHEMAVAISHSKNFGLYGERVGLLTFLLDSSEKIPNVSSHLKSIIRSIYSSPPAHGARIVSTILESDVLTSEWQEELANMRSRIIEMRKALTAELQSKGLAIDFSFIENQKGLFTLSGLSEEQVALLRAEHAIYMPPSGRMNVAGLNSYNVKIVAEAIQEVV